MKINWVWIVILVGSAGVASCTKDDRPSVVVYTALDPIFSRDIFQRFENETGIHVDAVYDTEAVKTTGLVERVRRESRRPRCDVFWNNEILRTIRLAADGHLEPYVSSSSKDIPTEFKDPQGFWTGFAARARTIAFDPTKIQPSEVPGGHAGLTDPRWRGRVSIANPAFGTTGSHLACLLASWGEERYREYLQALAQNEVRVVAGNATSRDKVLSGEVDLGLTDTDDVEVVRQRGAAIDDSLFRDEGAIVLPNTVALIKNSPHPHEARQFIDFVLSESIEEALAASKSRQIPVRSNVPVPASGLKLSDFRRSVVDYPAAARVLPNALRIAGEILR